MDDNYQILNGSNTNFSYFVVVKSIIEAGKDSALENSFGFFKPNFVFLKILLVFTVVLFR